MLLTMIDRHCIRGSGDLCGDRTIKSDLNADLTRYRMSKHMWRQQHLHDDVKQRGMKSAVWKVIFWSFLLFFSMW